MDLLFYFCTSKAFSLFYKLKIPLYTQSTLIKAAWPTCFLLQKVLYFVKVGNGLTLYVILWYSKTEHLNLCELLNHLFNSISLLKEDVVQNEVLNTETISTVNRRRDLYAKECWKICKSGGAAEYKSHALCSLLFLAKHFSTGGLLLFSRISILTCGGRCKHQPHECPQKNLCLKGTCNWFLCS